MEGILPYVTPKHILKYFNLHPINQIDFSKAKGQSVPLTMPTISDYFMTIPEKIRNRPEYSMKWHNGLLRMMQLLVNEGLLTPIGNASGFEQRYQGNGYPNPALIEYGYYDFLIFGFPLIREHFEDTVRPVILNRGVPDKIESIGTGFTIGHNRKLYFITASHCLPSGNLITIPMYVPPDEPLAPVNIFVPENDHIDLAVIETSDKVAISDKYFFLGDPENLDQILTMGYPPIQGFTEPILIAETAAIATALKSTTGRITGQGLHYAGGMMPHFLISARVKGGNSGGPVINKHGLVVGIVIESLENENSPDMLGYGLALSSQVVKELLSSIKGEDGPVGFRKLQFKTNSKGFTVS